MVLCLALVFARGTGPLTAMDKEVIEAAVTATHRIVFVYDTVDRSKIVHLLGSKTPKNLCRASLLARNSKPTSLKGYRPAWAAISVSAKDVAHWLKPGGSLFKETYVDEISLPAYCDHGTHAAIYLAQWTNSDGRWIGGVENILRLSMKNGKWQVDGKSDVAIRF